MLCPAPPALPARRECGRVATNACAPRSRRRLFLAVVCMIVAASKMAAPTAGPSRFTVVPASTSIHQDWQIECEHGVEALAARIPLAHIQSLSTPPESTPIFQPEHFRTTRPCFDGTSCFRAVRDDFATPEEIADLWRGVEEHYQRKGATDGEMYVGIQAGYFRHGLLGNITARMAGFLEDEMGARGVVVSHTNSRGEWRFRQNVSQGHSHAQQRREQLLRGEFSRRRGHIDAARPIYWHYTCLLYIGDHDAQRFAGGETLLIDKVNTRGQVRGGLLVEPRRGRLLAFSSGSENVHTALEATHGFRSLIQVWFKCEPRKRDSTSLPPPPLRVEL